MITSNIHGVDAVKIHKVVRRELDDGKPFYRQTITLKREKRDDVSFTVFFSEAVVAVKEQERAHELTWEQEAELERCQAMEQLAAKSCTCHHNA